MGFLWKRLSARRRSAVCLGVGALFCALSATATTPESNQSWQAALSARQAFESEPSGEHTKAEYSAIMDNFRAIYHGNPSDPHAAHAIEQVAELLAEQGHELNDKKSLRDAAGQYEFLAKAYPGGSMAAKAHAHALDLLSPDTPADPRPVAQTIDKPEITATPVSASHPMASVTGIRHWSTATYTRVAIDLGDEVEYQAARVESPDRIYFDLHHSRLAQELVGKSFAVTDDGLLTRIRAAQFSNDVTRVVLDVHDVGEYSAFLLPNPYRLIIDIHGKAGNNREQIADQAPSPRTQSPENSTPGQSV